ncbi:PREDICTED: uncharacterized protein LOC109183063 isoform X2 [Ipomoea nil]|uniref:uncharacterized protein LOC109183063 isoform X2 n=1 Tax=Ipomoea nil TaxID=35883 RepID=UPI00090150FD|nr:PREDICTED: uncharacterized protein LOC109183063 isoform X2 [Ipomoea nil]XP_019188819.1 PREDICTED: uncharacterized protein LOC109183063 isoform X2 [Ipomoea nil]
MGLHLKLCSDSSLRTANPKRRRREFSLFPCKKPRKDILSIASLQITPFGLPLISKTTGTSCDCMLLEPYKLYTIGRSNQYCDFLFCEPRVSKVHCQFFFDLLNKKIYLSDGVFLSFGANCSSRVRASLNGVFVNGIRIGKGEVVEICAGDEVSLVCGKGDGCATGIQIGFSVTKVMYAAEIADRHVINCNGSGVYSDYALVRSKNGGVTAKANILLNMSREILSCNDPIKCIRKCVILDHDMGATHKVTKVASLVLQENVEVPPMGDGAVRKDVSLCEGPEAGHSLACEYCQQTAQTSERNTKFECCNNDQEIREQMDNTGVDLENGIVANDKHGALSLECMEKEAVPQVAGVGQEREGVRFVPPPGKMFYLNQLHCINQSSSENVVSLPELLHPVNSIDRLFVATFSSDILWFLSYCEIPPYFPITIACHSAERCWSSSPDKRTSMPYPEFPNLIVVYPPFPEVIAFGKDRRKSGIGCHHPKLFLVQREDSIRVVITSANLVPRQWHGVTNTVWWQDFPRLSSPDYLSFFTQLPEGGVDKDSRSDFSTQLVGFIASLLADVPSQAYWILELAKYDFKGAVAYLVTSIPGVYSHRSPLFSEPRYFLAGGQPMPLSHHVKSLGSVEASVAGLSYIFRTSADSNGARLKKLATFLRKCKENMYGMTEVVLRRDSKIPADANAVSILVPNPEEVFMGDCVQLGFLPKDVAKWVAPLSDVGLFSFSAYIYPEEVLGAALEGSNNKVKLLLHVFQGPSFSSISNITSTEHISATCSLVRALQRRFGLWRLHEVLGQYKWPEHTENDFVFGSSSIGSINAQFLAAFSAAAGKRSLRCSESEESDPDWSCWSASQEIRNPSIRVIFPTAERVKSSKSGILSSRRILCFSEKTWQRLKPVGILHDAIPCPSHRDGIPMHVKVARRRFQSKADVPSFGWVYCGSHNFSAAAWGRPISGPLDRKANNNMRSNSVLGSRLHICNYEIGVVFIVPPTDTGDYANSEAKLLDDIALPFLVPAPKYKPTDWPATPRAMKEALAELSEREKHILESAAISGEWMEEEIPDENDEILEDTAYVAAEKEDEKAYADRLWCQVDSLQCR